jgi:glycosyltransferase involved in cell wall biosynthesis
MMDAIQEPFITIIMATLNSEKYIAEALDSVVKQGYPNYEVIIVDGSSTDTTVKIAQSYANIKIIEQQSKGLFGAWNEGIALAKGNYLAILDSDDIWEENCLKNHIVLFTKDPSLLGSRGYTRFFIEKDQTPPVQFKQSLLQQNHLNYFPGCFIGSKEMFELLGSFDTSLTITSDIEWSTKIKDLDHRVGVINEVVLNKRVHDKNLSYNAAKTATYSEELLKILHDRIQAKKSD